MTLGRSQLLGLLDAHELRPSRALGQNFVADANTVRRIARLARVGAGDHVVEIGAGLGSLTLALAETGADVTAIEVDRHLLPVLRSVLEGAPHPVRLVEGDARRLRWDALLAAAPRWTLVANLPYNIATPLVLDLLATVPALQRMLVMVQAEVGERLAASVGDKAYGIPSVKVAYRARARLVGRVSPEVFVPRPRVASVLVEVVRLARPAVEAEPGRLFELVQAGFGQRRKMVRRSLAGLLAPDAFERSGVRPEARAEELDLDAWARLAAAPAALDDTTGPDARTGPDETTGPGETTGCGG